MKFIISFCFVLLFSLVLIDCSQKESSPVNPEETNSLYKGKPCNVIVYEVSGDISGEGISVNGDIHLPGREADIDLVFSETETAFGELPDYISDGAEGIMAIGSRPDGSALMHYFDWSDHPGVEGYRGRFRIEGSFDKKESYPLTFTGHWKFEYHVNLPPDPDIVEITEGDGAVVIVDVRN